MTKLSDWMKTRARAGQIERVEAPEVMGEKNAGVANVTVTNHLHCPCSICGHKFQFECEEESSRVNGGCDCCSTTCT